MTLETQERGIQRDIQLNGVFLGRVETHGSAALNHQVALRVSAKVSVQTGHAVSRCAAKSHGQERLRTDDQTLWIVVSAQDWANAQTRGGDRKSDQRSTLTTDTVADRTAQSGAAKFLTFTDFY